MSVFLQKQTSFQIETLIFNISPIFLHNKKGIIEIKTIIVEVDN